MIAVNSVEQYFWFEVVNTFEVLIGFLTDGKRHTLMWQKQWSKLEKAFHLFMLDLDVDDFKNSSLYQDLKLPSEQKPKRDTKPKNTARDKTKKRISSEGKQLKLFFVKSLKNAVLQVVLAIEVVLLLVAAKKKVPPRDYENRFRA